MIGVMNLLCYNNNITLFLGEKMIFIFLWSCLNSAKGKVLDIDYEAKVISAIENSDFKELNDVLIEHGPNFTIDNGSTALIVALKRINNIGNLIKLVKLLIEKKVDLHAKDKYGKTALEIAKEKGYSDIVKIIESGILAQEIPATKKSKYEESRIRLKDKKEKFVKCMKALYR